MKNVGKGFKHFILFGLCCIMMLASSVTTFAAEKTGVWFSIYADDGVQFTNDDTYTVELMNKATEEKENVTVKAKDAEYNFFEVALPEGTYSVLNFKYNGPNQKLANLPVAVSNNFEASDMFDTVDIGIGKESALFIDSQYVNAYVYANEEEVYDEFRSPDVSELEETDDMVNAESSEAVTDNASNDTADVQDEVEKNAGENTKVKNNYLIGFLPVVFVACIVAVVLYILRKKKKI